MFFIQFDRAAFIVQKSKYLNFDNRDHTLLNTKVLTINGALNILLREWEGTKNIYKRRLQRWTFEEI
jgi:hypothetical protein